MTRERRENDVYETPRRLALDFCTWLSEIGFAPSTIWEPHSGTGSLVAAARRTWSSSKIGAFDLRGNVRSDALASGADSFLEHDWLQPLPAELTGLPKPDLILANPPFLGCEQHLALALERVAPGGAVVFLMSLNLMWPSRAKEAVWDLPGLERLQPFYPRPDFIGAGSTDAVSVAGFLFVEGYAGPTLFCRPRRWRGLESNAQAQLFDASIKASAINVVTMAGRECTWCQAKDEPLEVAGGALACATCRRVRGGEPAAEVQR